MNPPRQCLSCGYIVDGLSEPRCPECGRAFDPANPRTYHQPDPAIEQVSQTAWLIGSSALLTVLGMLVLTGPWDLCRAFRLVPDIALAAGLWAVIVPFSMLCAALLGRAAAWAPLCLIPACALIVMQALHYRLYYSLAAAVAGPLLGIAGAQLYRAIKRNEHDR